MRFGIERDIGAGSLHPRRSRPLIKRRERHGNQDALPALWALDKGPSRPFAKADEGRPRGDLARGKEALGGMAQGQTGADQEGRSSAADRGSLVLSMPRKRAAACTYNCRTSQAPLHECRCVCKGARHGEIAAYPTQCAIEFPIQKLCLTFESLAQFCREKGLMRD